MSHVKLYIQQVFRGLPLCSTTRPPHHPLHFTHLPFSILSTCLPFFVCSFLCFCQPQAISQLVRRLSINQCHTTPHNTIMSFLSSFAKSSSFTAQVSLPSRTTLQTHACRLPSHYHREQHYRHMPDTCHLTTIENNTTDTCLTPAISLPSRTTLQTHA